MIKNPMRKEVEALLNQIKTEPQKWKLCFSDYALRPKWHLFPTVGEYTIWASWNNYVLLTGDEVTKTHEILDTFRNKSNTIQECQALNKLHNFLKQSN